jgi:hypothetical protein
MRNAVLDRPVAPAGWVNETQTVGAGAGSAIEAQSVDRSVYELFLYCPGRLTGSSHTESLHLAPEQQYLTYARLLSGTYFHDLDHIRARLLAAISGPEVAPDQPTLPSTIGRDAAPRFPALQAAADLRTWLHITYDEVAAMSGLAKRTIHHWRATGAQPHPATVRRLLEIHALVDALRRTLGPDRAGDWFRTGVPSPLQLLNAGDWSSVQEAMHDVLFRQPRKERDFAGHSPYDSDTDFAVGSQEDRQFRRATRSPRRGRLPQP